MESHKIHGLTAVSVAAAATIGLTIGAAFCGSLAGTIACALLATVSFTCMLAAAAALVKIWNKTENAPDANFVNAFKDTIVVTAPAVLAYLAMAVWHAIVSALQIVLVGKLVGCKSNAS